MAENCVRLGPQLWQRQSLNPTELHMAWATDARAIVVFKLLGTGKELWMMLQQANPFVSPLVKAVEAIGT